MIIQYPVDQSVVNLQKSKLGPWDLLGLGLLEEECSNLAGKSIFQVSFLVTAVFSFASFYMGTNTNKSSFKRVQ